MRADAEEVRAGVDAALGIERIPAGAVEPGVVARPAPLCARQSGSRHALGVLAEAVERADRFPGERAAIAPGRERVRPVALVIEIDVVGEGAGGDAVGIAADVERARIDRGVRRAAEIGLRGRGGIVEEQRTGIGQPDIGRDVERELELEIILLLMLEPGRAEHADGSAGAVDFVIAAAGGRARSGGRGRAIGGDVEERLALAIDMIGADEPGERAGAIADGRADAIDGQIAIRAILIEGLQADARADARFQFVGQARGDVDDRADRIARIGRREGPVEDFDPINLLRRDHRPARGCGRVVVADQRREQRAVGIDQAARAGADARGARGERRLGVADMAFADDEARQIFERILDIGPVDRGGDAAGIDRGVRPGRVFDRLDRPFAGDDDHGRRILGISRRCAHGDGHGQEGASNERAGWAIHMMVLR